MSARRFLPGLALGLILLLVLGGALYFKGYRLMRHAAAPGPAAPAPGAKEGRKIKYYVSPMDPTIVSKTPAKDPMGMDFIPVYEDTGPAMAPGTIAVDPKTVQSIGVRTAKVEVRPLSRVIRAVGKVMYDENQLKVVNTKVDGWVTRLYVKITGEPVRKGQRLVSLYSRELVPAQREYLQALKNLKTIGKSPFPEIAEGARRLAEASRMRLEYFDIPASEINRLARTGQVRKELTLTSPVSGIVTDRLVTDGQFVMAGMTLLKVADLSTVWVEADIYEYELPWVAVGQQAVMTLSYLPGKTYKGVIEYIYPYLRGKTRTARVRMKFPNPGYKLKPDMYAKVEIKSPLQPLVTVVPNEAVMDTGERQHVFVALGRGRFQPREIKVGVHGQDGLLQVLSGLKEGEEVVTSAQFLLDSESRFREAAAKFLAGPEGEKKEAPAPKPTHAH
ncbi:MAG: efflux RND transporter periplasmic adaptor subunit [Syntrophales bacterium]|nr:efflux RND transporter periplasmic adaptor subunit [Syntrophales bacterium]